MLKQEINYKDLKLDIEKVKLNNYLITENYNNKGYEKVVTCFVDDIENFSVGMALKCMISVDGYDANGNKCVHPYQYTPQIKSIDQLNKSFSFNIVTYITLPLMYVDEYIDINENKVWEFNFVEPHLYTPKEKGSIKIIYNDYDFLNGSDICELTDGEYIDDNTLKFKFDDSIEHIIDVGNKLFDNNYYSEIDKPDDISWVDNVNSFDIKPYNVYYDSPEYIRVGMNESNFTYFKKILGKSNVINIACLRDNILFDDINNFELYYNKLKTCINIPLSQTFETNLHKQEILEDTFIRNEIENSVNQYIDMEKHVYHPVLVEKDDVNEKYHGIKKIKFNLHFLERNGEDWLVDETSFWNGVRKDKLELKNKSNVSYYPFFSYEYNPEHQSDLLKFLGFSTDDVRYQREKLKRSFLRLSFYDSRDQNNQNLLGYSTIFMDSGKLFSKLMRHVDDQPYNPVVDINKNGFVTGININVEPTEKLLKGTGGDFEKIEDYRLSSQFSVEDRNNSLSSSEGFYMYLWADNDAINVPNDIYMKVEFNHAGFGRTIPFMMPFFDKVGSDKGIKTFKNILNDWKIGGYSIKRYLKYSYIHFKYKYDKINKKHIYYLDPDTYGDSSTYDIDKNNDILFLDLYEGKFNFNNEDESEGENEDKLPISQKIYNLKIESFKWNFKNPNYEDEKVINFDPCGGTRSMEVYYSYKLMKIYKTYDECYLYYPNILDDTYGEYKYVKFNTHNNKYCLVNPNNPLYKPPIKDVVTIDVKPSDYTGTKHPYVRYNNELYYYDNSYKYYYKYIENKVNEPIITNEICNNKDGIKDEDTTFEYIVKSRFINLFSVNKEKHELKAHENTFPFSIASTVKVKIKIRKDGINYFTDDLSDDKALKMFIKTCKEFEEEGNQIKKYYTITSDLQNFLVTQNNSRSQNIENYPNIDTCNLVPNNNNCSMFYEKIETTFSTIFPKDSTNFDVTISAPNNFNIVNSKTSDYSKNNKANDFFTYDLPAYKESIFVLPSKIYINSYKNGPKLNKKVINGYDTILDAQNNKVDFLYLEKNNNTKEIIETDRIDIFNIIFIKEKFYNNSIIKVIDNDSEKWAKVVRGKNNMYELHVMPNLGMYRECILCFSSKDNKNNIYNINKIITQNGSGNCILKVKINNSEKPYEHVKLCRTYQDKNGIMVEETYGEELENNKEYFFVEDSTIKIKAYVDEGIDENGETINLSSFKNFNGNIIKNVIELTMDTNKELVVNFGK